MTQDAPKDLWKPRSVEETLELYADWADDYDAAMEEWGYLTPGRIAAALAAHLTDKAAPILDFGCGTGRSGEALRAAGFTTIDGTDISSEMIAHVGKTGVYRRHWQGEPGVLKVAPGDYAAITAMGVISYGAAPPETMDLVLGCLAPGGVLALSYNDATLTAADYLAKLDQVQKDGTARLLFEEYGPHLREKDMGSAVYILEKA